MFDNTRPNVIILSDYGSQIYMEKTLGPYKIAKQLRDAGFQVAVVHHLMTFSVAEIKHILKNLISDKTLFVGVNNFFYYKPINNDGKLDLVFQDTGSIIPHGKHYNEQIKNYIQECNPKCKLVIGGPNACDIEDYNSFDYVLLGYGEMSVINLAKHLENPVIDLDKSYKSHHGFTVIDDSKAASYDFVNHIMTYEEHDALLENEPMVIEVGRGCIFQCKFCSYPLNGKKKLDHVRTEESLYTEFLENYEKHGITRYQISDDTLNDCVEKCEMLANIAERLPFQPEYWAYIRLDLLTAHPETIEMLYKSGLRATFYGIESLNEESAKFIGKGGPREKLIDTLKFVNKTYNINQTGGFIFGLPYESLQSMRETADWLLSDDNPLDSWLTLPLMIRNTDLVEGGNGFISDIDRNWKSYGYIDTGIKTSKFYTKGLIPWKNQYTDFNEVISLIEEMAVRGKEIKKDTQSISGRHCLHLAGLSNSSIDEYSKLDHSSINWQRLDRLKLARATEYKNKLFKHCNIPDFARQKEYTTFMEFLTSNEYF